MTKLTLYTRSFHPDANFGVGGLGFKGDNRRFKGDPKVSSRIEHQCTIDLVARTLTGVRCRSDPSSNDILTKATNAPGEDVERMINSLEPITGRRVDIPEIPPFKNDYQEKRKKPRHKEKSCISEYREDGNQSVDMCIEYAGKNFAFPASNTDIMHDILGGPRSNEERDDMGENSNWPQWNGVVPDLDVVHRLTIQINRAEKRASILSTTAGDGFPNMEAFIYDAAEGLLMLATHVRVGTAATQLPGGRLMQMTHSDLSLDWESGDVMGASVEVENAADYMSFGREDIIEDGVTTRDLWNKAHLGREASGNFLRQLQDHLPLPTRHWPTRDDLLDLEGEHEGP